MFCSPNPESLYLLFFWSCFLSPDSVPLSHLPLPRSLFPPYKVTFWISCAQLCLGGCWGKCLERRVPSQHWWLKSEVVPWSETQEAYARDSHGKAASVSGSEARDFRDTEQNSQGRGVGLCARRRKHGSKVWVNRGGKQRPAMEKFAWEPLEALNREMAGLTYTLRFTSCSSEKRPGARAKVLPSEHRRQWWDKCLAGHGRTVRKGSKWE